MYSLQAHLPTPMQTVFELFTEHQFNLSEIAKIRDRTVEEVEKLLDATRESLHTSLLRLPNNSD